MERMSRIIFLGFMSLVMATVACGGSEPEVPIETAPIVEVDPAARAAAERLVARLGSANVELVPTQRGTAEITYMQPIADRESGFIVTSIPIKNVAVNAISRFQVDEFRFDSDGNTVTGDQVRFSEPIQVGEVKDIELRVPRVPSMDRSNYEFTHQNGDILATLQDEIEDPEPEEEEGEEDSAGE